MAEKDSYTVKEAETKFLVDQSVLDYLRLFEIELYLASNQVFKYNMALLYMDGVTLFITQDILVKNVTNRGKGVLLGSNSRETRKRPKDNVSDQNS